MDMNKLEELKEMLQRKEYEIFTLDMKDRWDANDHSLMDHLKMERDDLKKQILEAERDGK